MKRIVLSFAVIGLTAVAGHAEDAPLARAAKFYKMNHYEQAVRFHRFIGKVGPEEKGKAYLSLGVFFLDGSALYGELHEAALSVNLDHLKNVASVKGRDRSRMVNLYIAETLLEAGKAREASFYFSKVLKDAKVGARHKAIAKAGLGLAFHLRGQKGKAESTWAGLAETEDPEVLLELAAVYAVAGSKERDPAGMCERALGILKKQGKDSIRVVKNAVGVYAWAGQVQKGLDFLWDADLKAYSHEEVLGENKVIRFYDPALMGNVSRLYAKAGVYYLKRAVETSGGGDVALYYLGEAYSRLGMLEEAEASFAAFNASPGAPGKFRGSAEVGQAALLYRKGRKAEALKRLEELSVRYARDPLMQAEVLFACGALGADCNGAVSRAASLAEAGQGGKFSRLNHALGSYYLGRNDLGRAIAHMEAGRDKSNKNRIERNDPLMLVRLASAYYGAKNFSEALEIFFEMSGQFPAVRQIQVALQGAYSVEQKSAGDVKVQ